MKRLLLLLPLLGCAGLIPPARGPAGPGKVAVTGKVRLSPPLHKLDQDLKGLGSERVRNKLYLVVDGGRIEATLGKPFSVHMDRKPFTVTGGELFVTTTKRAYFPGGLKVDVRPDDRAVYIGTIVYHRDEFFNVTKVTIEDDGEQGRARKALARAASTRTP